MARRFSEKEAQRVFARAAERQHAHAAPPDGLTLAELQEIGRAAGLDPDHIAAAVTESEAEFASQETWHGVPVGVHRTRLLPARVSDAEWERIVDLLRAEFKARGVTEQVGRRREWLSAGQPGSFATRVTVEERPDGDLVTIRKPDAARRFGTGSLMSLGGAGVLLAILLSVIVGVNAPAVALSIGMIAFGVALYGAAFLSAQIRSRREPAQAEALLDRIDLLSRADRPARDPESQPVERDDSGGAGRLDLDALPDTAGGGAADRRRDRA